jgi:hypothetical protein
VSLTPTLGVHLDTILKRSEYFIWYSVRWGDYRDVKDEGDHPLLYVHWPLGYAGWVGLATFIAILFVLGLGGALAKGVGILILLVVAFFALNFVPKQEIFFHLDQERQKLVFRVSEKRRATILSRWCDLHGEQGELIASLKKDFSVGSRVTWTIQGPKGEMIARAIGERSWADKLSGVMMKIGKSAHRSVPVFRVFQKSSSIVLGEVRLHSGAGDHVDLAPDKNYVLDRRMALALAVLVRGSL